jgi:hypothetical protein
LNIYILSPPKRPDPDHQQAEPPANTIMPGGFQKASLFGGALVCDLPDKFADVR